MDIQNGQQNSVEKYRVDGMSLKDKSNKIVTALHMVTDCIEDNEPIRFKIRTLAVELASNTHLITHTPAHERGFIFSDLEITATEIFSFLQIARSLIMISEINADILIRELKANMDKMRAWVETGFYETDSQVSNEATSQSFTLNDSHFKISNEGSNKTPQTVQKSDIEAKGHNIQQNVSTVMTPKKTIMTQKEEQTNSRKFDFAVKLTRRNTILKIIKDKKEVTIKDISELIVDCSEKTIQRELIVLVGEGVLKKIGHKRWSKYTIA